MGQFHSRNTSSDKEQVEEKVDYYELLGVSHDASGEE